MHPYSIRSGSRLCWRYYGEDSKVVGDELLTNPLAHPGEDKNITGLRTRLRQGVAEKFSVLADADELIRNTNRTLMIFGMKGTLIYCVDPELQKYLKTAIANR